MSVERRTIGQVASGGLIIDGDWIESKDQDPSGSIRLIQLADIGDGDFLDKSARYINSETAVRLGCTFIKENDLLIARMPDPIGRACIFPLKGEGKFITAVDVCILRVNKNFYPRYVMHAINAPTFRRQIVAYSTGTTRQRISRKNLETLTIPAPSLPVQKQVADTLDKADALRKKDEQLLQKYDELAQSIFYEMFGDPVHNHYDWPIKKFCEVGKLDRGVSKHRPRNAPELLGGRYPLIQTGDIANSGGYITSFNQTYSEVGLKQSKLWKKGTLCITIAANIAKTAVLTFDSCFPDSIVGFIPNELVTVNYTRFWLGHLQKTLEETAPESAQKNINLDILRNLSIPVPPPELQRIFEQLIQNIEKQKTVIKQNSIESDLLFEMINSTYFS